MVIGVVGQHPEVAIQLRADGFPACRRGGVAMQQDHPLTVACVGVVDVIAENIKPRHSDGSFRASGRWSALRDPAFQTQIRVSRGVQHGGGRVGE